MSIEIYEVQSAALADGVYVCYKQCLLATGWEAGHGDKFEDVEVGDPPAPVPVEVLNLLESYTVPDYTRALAFGDRMIAWPLKDCAGTIVLVGRPITPDVRMARTTEDPGNSQWITCDLIANDGETQIQPPELGGGIKVYFKPTNSANMNAVSPLFASGDYLFTQNINGKWWFVDVPQGKENCANPPP